MIESFSIETVVWPRKGTRLLLVEGSVIVGNVVVAEAARRLHEADRFWRQAPEKDWSSGCPPPFGEGQVKPFPFSLPSSECERFLL
jgi:hypothetical protein